MINQKASPFAETIFTMLSMTFLVIGAVFAAENIGAISGQRDGQVGLGLLIIPLSLGPIYIVGLIIFSIKKNIPFIVCYAGSPILILMMSTSNWGFLGGLVTALIAHGWLWIWYSKRLKP